MYPPLDNPPLQGGPLPTQNRSYDALPPTAVDGGKPLLEDHAARLNQLRQNTIDLHRRRLGQEQNPKAAEYEAPPNWVDREFNRAHSLGVHSPVGTRPPHVLQKIDPLSANGRLQNANNFRPQNSLS